MVVNIVEKDKKLITSNCSFSHNVLKGFLSQVYQNLGLHGKEYSVNPLVH